MGISLGSRICWIPTTELDNWSRKRNLWALCYGTWILMCPVIPLEFFDRIVHTVCLMGTSFRIDAGPDSWSNRPSIGSCTLSRVVIQLGSSPKAKVARNSYLSTVAFSKRRAMSSLYYNIFTAFTRIGAKIAILAGDYQSSSTRKGSGTICWICWWNRKGCVLRDLWSFSRWIMTLRFS